jgi:hypothetical protein
VECRRRSLLCVFIEQPTAYSADIEPELRRRLWMTPPDEPYTLDLADIRRVAATYNRWLADTARPAGLPFCATAAGLPARSEIFQDDCHFTVEGSRRLASAVTDCLVVLRDRFPSAPHRTSQGAAGRRR